MTKEEIIEIIKMYSVSRHFEEYREITHEDCECIADELLESIEQEKKATIKLILLGFQCALDDKQPERAVEETILRIAERYGVEL